VTWAVYRETATLDPIKAFDYPDNAAVALTCDARARESRHDSRCRYRHDEHTELAQIVFTLHGREILGRHPVTAMTWCSV
jgi:hypothetical protein